MPGVVLIVLIPEICLLPYFQYSHEYGLTRNTVYCSVLSDQIVVGCPLGVPILYYFLFVIVKGKQFIFLTNLINSKLISELVSND